MTTPEIERKVRQLDNDVQSSYQMLASISATQQRQGNRLEEIAAAQADAAGERSAQGEKLDTILELLRGKISD